MPTPQERLNVGYEGSTCYVRIVGEITEDLACDLGDIFEESFGDYFMETCVLEINSPGGSVDALEYVLDLMDKWRRKEGIRFETRALFQATSAAALLAAFGDVGLRSALGSSVLLFHESRAYGASSRPITAHDAQTIMDSLKQIDEKIIRRLSGHIFSGLGRLPEKERRERCLKFQEIARNLGETPKENTLEKGCLERTYAALFSGERPVTPAVARELLLLDQTV